MSIIISELQNQESEKSQKTLSENKKSSCYQLRSETKERNHHINKTNKNSKVADSPKFKRERERRRRKREKEMKRKEEQNHEPLTL